MFLLFYNFLGGLLISSVEYVPLEDNTNLYTGILLDLNPSVKN